MTVKEETKPSSENVMVTAPTRMNGGYVFEAEYDGKIVSITVPKGGVSEGQHFQVPKETLLSNIEIPAGEWRDGLCACFQFGCFHPMFCMALCLPTLALGQIMTRLRLTWLGTRGPSNYTFNIMCAITAVYYLLTTFGKALMDNDPKSPLSITYYVFVSIFQLYVWVVIAMTREYIRYEYSIPSRCCGCAEDFLCAYFCQCCVIAQMGRHTANYKIYGGYCCSKTGLDPGVSTKNVTNVKGVIRDIEMQ